MDTLEKSHGPWNQFGGSSRYASAIVKLFPEHRVYVEPFMGAASCLFTKERSQREILADVDRDSVFAMRFVQSLTDSKLARLAKMPRVLSRAMHDRAKSMEPRDEMERFWKFIYLRRASFSGSHGYRLSHTGETMSWERLARFVPRLQGVEIVLQDYRETLKLYDSRDTFFFVDPPYPGEWNSRLSVIRDGHKFDLAEMSEKLRRLNGKYIVAYGDTSEQIATMGRFSGSKFQIRIRETRSDGGDKSALRYFHANFKVAKADTAPVHPSGEGQDEPVAFDDVTGDLKPIKIRSPFVSLVGSVATQGESRNDVDLLIHGPLDEKTRQVVEFRLGRMFEPEISQRVQFHDESLGGPFTSHANLYDLVMVPREDATEIVEMSKGLSRYQDWPKHRPTAGVVQLHCIGRTAHFDVRFQVDGHLIGWTLPCARKGKLPDVNTPEQARKLYAGWKKDGGNKYLKGILAPSGLLGVTKQTQPVEWLDVDDRVFKPGEVGAFSRQEGVMIAVAHPKVEWGIQEPYFHEYFLTEDDEWAGSLLLRLLVGGRGEETPKGDTYWRAIFAKKPFPYVLTDRAVKKGTMPPLGKSALPKSFEDALPKGLHYWEAKTEDEARRIRDTIVESGVLEGKVTPKTNGEFDILPLAKSGSVRFALSWLYWRGPMVIRQGPSRQEWWLFLEDGPGIRGFRLAEDPLEVDVTSAVEHEFNGHSLLTADQTLRPGEAIDGNVLNATKATEAWLRILDTGQVKVEDKGDEIELRISGDKAKGEWRLTREESGSEIWTLESSAGVEKRGVINGSHPSASVEKVVVNYSGGIDSTAALIWAVKTYGKDKVIALFSDIAESIPVKSYVEMVAKRLGVTLQVVKPEKTLTEVFLEKGRWPYRWHPYCQESQVFKPVVKWLKQNCDPKTTLRVVGSTAGQRPPQNGKRTPAQSLDDAPEFRSWAPVYYMSRDEIAEYIRANNVPIWDGYAKGYVRTACYCCPFMAFPQASAVRQYLPKKWQKNLDLEMKLGAPEIHGRSWVEMADKGDALRKQRGLPSWVAKGDGDDPSKPSRVNLKPGDRFRPMKPSGGFRVTEFRDVPELVGKWLTPEALKAGVWVEPKWNGMRTIASKHGDEVSIFFEDSKEERAKILPGVAAELATIPGDFILDSELLDFAEDGTVKRRSSLGRFTGPVDPQDDSRVRLHVFGILYWSEQGGNLTAQDADVQRETLGAFFDGHEWKHLELTPARRVDTLPDLEKAAQWAREQPGSEGAMLKLSSSTYSLGGKTHSWAKLKAVRHIRALVITRHKVKGSESTFDYDCAIGPVAGGNWGETEQFDGKKWVRIGTTGNTNLAAVPGDVIEAEVFELFADTRDKNPWTIHWFGPAQVTQAFSDGTKPMTVSQVLSLAVPGEIRKSDSEETMRICKTTEERYVLGIVLEPTDGADGSEWKPDSQHDIYSKEEIRRVAHQWMEQFKRIGFMHRALINDRVSILESFVVPDGTGGFDVRDPEGETQHVQEGTWLLGLRINDDELWGKVKRGEISGLSIGGSARRVPAKGA